jgi:hypothetical protein
MEKDIGDIADLRGRQEDETVPEQTIPMSAHQVESLR